MNKFSENVIPDDFRDIFNAVKVAWAGDTSVAADWTPALPELGQCAVTALLVQEAYGGILKRALVNGVSHYWNEIDGQLVDLTRAQFTNPLFIEDELERERAYVLSFPATAERYLLLKDRILI